MKMDSNLLSSLKGFILKSVIFALLWCRGASLQAQPSVRPCLGPLPRLSAEEQTGESHEEAGRALRSAGEDLPVQDTPSSSSSAPGASSLPRPDTEQDQSHQEGRTLPELPNPSPLSPAPSFWFPQLCSVSVAGTECFQRTRQLRRRPRWKVSSSDRKNRQTLAIDHFKGVSKKWINDPLNNQTLLQQKWVYFW